MAGNALKLHRGGEPFGSDAASACVAGIGEWCDGAAETFAQALEGAGWNGRVRIQIVLEPSEPECRRHQVDAEALTTLARVKRGRRG